MEKMCFVFVPESFFGLSLTREATHGKIIQCVCLFQKGRSDYLFLASLIGMVGMHEVRFHSINTALRSTLAYF